LNRTQWRWTGDGLLTAAALVALFIAAGSIGDTEWWQTLLLFVAVPWPIAAMAAWRRRPKPFPAWGLMVPYALVCGVLGLSYGGLLTYGLALFAGGNWCWRHGTLPEPNP
jgi:hypothetical protein